MLIVTENKMLHGGAYLHVKRVYAEPADDDGRRILVDRLWPRGLTKEKAKVDLWLKDIAPSNELRRWFGHDPKRWAGFERKYFEELKTLAIPLALLRREASHEAVITLLYGARDEEHNEAVVLREFLRRRFK
jgi:uncharacterized protein YeaO (DUF488 family)